MASTLKLIFSDIAVAGDYIYINVDTPTGLVQLRETYKNLRQATKEVSVGNTINKTADNFRIAWNLDYKNYGGMNNIGALLGVDDGVTLYLENDSWNFNVVPVSSNLIGQGKLTYELNNSAIEAEKSVDFVDYNKGTSTCENLVSNFTATGGDGVYSVYVDDVLTLSGQGANFVLNLTRGKNYLLRVVDSAGTTIKSIYFRTPRKLIGNDLNIAVDNLEAGATVSITDTFISEAIYPFQYSLDGVTYKTQNSFTGIADGEYTLYVKDDFGCVFQKAFFVDGYTDLTETVFTISNLNPIRYAVVEGGKKNHLNTLSCNELKQVRYPYYHKYLIDDVITTQFKTNANYLNTYAIDSAGVKTPLTNILKTSNTNKQIKTTGTYFYMTGGKSAIHFGVVNELDFVTEAVIGSVDYGFALPEWANKVGDYVTISGVGQVKIADIQYSDAYDSFVLIFDVVFVGAAEERIVSAQYNIQPYEVYEFSADMALLPEFFNIVVEAGFSANEIQFTSISEKIQRVQDSDKLFEITYWNSSNIGNLVYQTGVKNTLRLEGYVDYIGDQETEGYDGDQEFYVTDNSIYDSQRFVFHNLTSEVARMLRGVVAHDNLTINGLGYKLAESPEITTNFMSNFKSFSVSLKRGGNVFLDSSQEIISGSSEIESISGAIEASKGKSLILWTK